MKKDVGLAGYFLCFVVDETRYSYQRLCLLEIPKNPYWVACTERSGSIYKRSLLDITG
jgi:hypothetical protein